MNWEAEGMEERLYQLHQEAGRVCGRETTCGKKHGYETEEEAGRAAEAHNRWEGRRHDVEPYPCYFCAMWHIGRIMPEAILEEIIRSELSDE
jgi:hypothetical protein